MIDPVESASQAVALMGTMVSEAALQIVLSRVPAHAAAYYAQFASRDVVLTPVLLKPPVKVGEINASMPLGDLAQRLVEYADYTMLQNAVGGPAISLPLPLDRRRPACRASVRGGSRRRAHPAGTGF